ncbi:alpha/beta fold hydrolase [Haliangium sp.]|uniref:alpha/beta fold hydrolase n=1 Tax=Haliangium sp. TaxID=2663208 RepID=UPI003D0E02E3
MIAGLLIALLALVLASVLDYRRFQTQRRRVEQSFLRLDLPWGALPYVDVGPRDGPVVLVCTGGGAGIDSVAALDELTEAGYRLIAVCRPGYYDVPLTAAPTLADHADLYHAVISALELGAVHVFGLSAGGPSALYYAARYPTRSLVLWSAVTGPYVPNRESMETPLGRLVLAKRGQALVSWSLWRFARWMPRTTMTTFLRAEATLDRKEIARVIDETLRDRRDRDRFKTFVASTTPMSKLYSGMMDEIDKMGAEWAPDWASIQAPTLAVGSPVDKDVSYDHLERIRARLPNAQIMSVRAGGHFVWWGREGREVLAATLAHFGRS